MKSLLEDVPSGAPEWTMTYGDLMSLLLTLFVMLVSMSEMKNTEKYRGVADALHQKFGSATLPALAPGVGRPRNPRLALPIVASRQTRQSLLQDLQASEPVILPELADHSAGRITPGETRLNR